MTELMLVDQEITSSSEINNAFNMPNYDSQIKYEKVPNCPYEIDLDALRIELNNEIIGHKSVAKSDGNASIIIWRYLKHIPFNYMAIDGVQLWLALELKEYIRERFYDKKKGRIDVARYNLNASRGKDRHAIARLYWGAKLSEGQKKIIRQLFDNQDLSVAILERVWSHKIPFIKWFFEYMNEPISKFENIPDESDKQNSVLDFTNMSQKRMIVKIFYAFVSQYMYDQWSQNNFNTNLHRAINYTFKIYYCCFNEYKRYSKNLEKSQILSNTKLEKQVAKLNNIPLDLNAWFDQLHQ